MSLCNDNDLKKFQEKIKILEYIEKSESCSTREIRLKFEKISKSDLYRKIVDWEKAGLLIKDFSKKERKFYSHFLVRKTPQLKNELLSLYNELIDLFSNKYNEIAQINQILETRNEKSKVIL